MKGKSCEQCRSIDVVFGGLILTKLEKEQNYDNGMRTQSIYACIKEIYIYYMPRSLLK